MKFDPMHLQRGDSIGHGISGKMQIMEIPKYIEILAWTCHDRGI